MKEDQEVHRALIEAQSKRFSPEGGPRAALDQAYLLAMKDAQGRFPEVAEVRTRLCPLSSSLFLNYGIDFLPSGSSLPFEATMIGFSSPVFLQMCCSSS